MMAVWNASRAHLPTMANKLVICLLKHHTLFDKGDANDKNNDLKDNMSAGPHR